MRDTESNTVFTHSDTTVPKANTRWYYRVSAINSVGTGEPSDAASAVTSTATIPGAPMDLTAWEEGPTRIVLLWQAPDDTGGEITGYKIEYSNANTNGNASDDNWMDLVANTMSDATTYIDHGSVAELKAGDVRFLSGGRPSTPAARASMNRTTTALSPAPRPCNRPPAS